MRPTLIHGENWVSPIYRAKAVPIRIGERSGHAAFCVLICCLRYDWLANNIRIYVYSQIEFT